MKAEVRRGKKFVEYHDPETQPEGTFTQEISIADVSYQDETGNWNALDESWETDGFDGFAFRAARMNHKVRFDSIGAWRWYPRRNVDAEYIIFNRPQCWLSATKRWVNLLASSVSREGKSITITSLRKVTRVIHSRWYGIKTDWILLDASSPTRFRQKVDLVGITETDGALYGADGTRLGQLTPTTATDANGTALPCTGSYASGYIEFQADVTGAVYPVIIDPDFAIGNTNYGDFGMHPGGAPHYNSQKNYGASPTFVISNGVNAIFRFDLSTIPSGSTCTAVTFKPTKVSGSSTNNRTYYIYSLAKANKDWIEGTKNGEQAGSGEPCYAARKADGSGGVTEAWAGSEGCNTSGTDYEATALMSVTQNSAAANPTQYEWTFNEDGIARVEEWFGSITKNYGMMIKGNAYEESTFAFSENATESYRPILTVTYTGGIQKHYLHYARLRGN